MKKRKQVLEILYLLCEKLEMLITERSNRKKFWILKKTGKKMTLKLWCLELKFKAVSDIKEVKISEVYKELTRIAVKLWRAELELGFFSRMLTEGKDVKCSREGGIWLVRYERESWYFFKVVFKQSRRKDSVWYSAGLNNS